MSEDVAHAEATDSSLSPYQLLPATPDDAEAIMAFNKRAFQNDYMMSQVYPKEKSHLTSPEELFAWRVKRLRTEVEKGDMLYSKVVQKDVNKLVAQRGWAPPGYFRPGMTLSDKFGKSTIQSSSDAPSREVLEPPATTGQDNEGFPASMNRAVHKDVLAIMDEERAKIWEGDANYWCQFYTRIQIDMPSNRLPQILARLRSIQIIADKVWLLCS